MVKLATRLFYMNSSVSSVYKIYFIPRQIEDLTPGWFQVLNGKLQKQGQFILSSIAP